VRFFVYEYVSARVDLALPASLRQEGEAMLRAVAADLAWIAGAEVRTLPASTPEGEQAAFRVLARWADFSLVIAPEFDNILYDRCRWVEEENGNLLGPSSTPVALTSDKLTLGEHLRAQGVRTPVCWPIDHAPLSFPLVCKPRFGAGSLATFRIDQPESLTHSLAVARAEGWTGEMILQAYAPGVAASVSFLCGPQRNIALIPASQQLSIDGRFRYQGGSLPLPPLLADRAVRIAQSAVTAVPSLLGYIGVDVVLGDKDNGSEDWAIEINPRLTTSYLGLRMLAAENLAELMVRTVVGESVETPCWRNEIVRFTTI
jgi:predicted ATP-grasp superfamily ATP-dependent carboligase